MVQGVDGKMRYMMTCGHNSNNANKCPFKCPKSKSLIDLEEQQQEESVSKVDLILDQIDNLAEEEKVILLGKFTEVEDEDDEDDQGETEE